MESPLTFCFTKGKLTLIANLKERTKGEKAAEAKLAPHTEESAVELSPEIQEKAAHFMDNYMSYLTGRTEALYNGWPILRHREQQPSWVDRSQRWVINSEIS